MIARSLPITIKNTMTVELFLIDLLTLKDRGLEISRTVIQSKYLKDSGISGDSLS